MNDDNRIIAEFIRTMLFTYDLYQLELINEEEFNSKKVAAINIALYSYEHYNLSEMEEAILILHNRKVLSKQEYWQIKARLTLYKKAAS
jgi:hypothetical protein